MSNVTNSLESVEAELAKLQAPDDKEAQRKAKIRQLLEQKDQILSAQAEAEKQELIEDLLADFERHAKLWNDFEDQFQNELVKIYRDYSHHRQSALIASSLQSQIESLGAKPMPYFPIPHPDLGTYVEQFGRIEQWVEPEPDSPKARYQEVRRAELNAGWSLR